MIDRDPIERQLSLARHALTPPARLRARVRARFGESEPIPAAGVRAGVSARGNGWRALRASGNVGLAVGAGLFGLGCLAGLLGSGFVTQREATGGGAASGPLHDPSELAVPEASPLPAAPLDSPEAALAEAAPMASASPAPPSARARESTPEAVTSRSKPERRAQRASPPRDWRGELALLERAERAVRADKVDVALALLGDFDARYPRSLLVEERAAVEAMAHCQVEATDGAARARRFLSAYPKSLYRARVAALCEPQSAPAGPSSDKKIDPGH